MSWEKGNDDSEYQPWLVEGEKLTIDFCGKKKTGVEWEYQRMTFSPCIEIGILWGKFVNS